MFDLSYNYDFKDGSAIDCTHYIGEEDTLVFDSGETKKDILVPIINDTSGAKLFFTIELKDVVGPGSLGSNETATVNINNIAGWLLSSILFEHKILKSQIYIFLICCSFLLKQFLNAICDVT